MNILAWNNEIGPGYYFVGLRTEVMINRVSWGYSYSIVRGEILGFLVSILVPAMSGYWMWASSLGGSSVALGCRVADAHRLL